MKTPRGRYPLRHLRWQAVLAAAALGAAMALPVVLVSVGGGVAQHELAQLEQTGYQIVVSADGLHGIEYAHTDRARLLAVPGVLDAEPVLGVALDVFNASGNVTPTLVEGVVPSAFGATLSPTERGLFPLPLPLGDPNDSVHYANGSYTGPTTNDVVLSNGYAGSHHVGVGSTVTLSPTTNESLGTPYTVTGLLGVVSSPFQPAGAFAAVVLLSNLQSLAGYGGGGHPIVPDGADTIEVVVVPSAAESPTALAGVAAAVQRLLPSYTVTTVSSEASALRSADAILTGFYLALSSVGLVVGLLFLALVLVRRVERERRSIAIRRAIGVRGSTIGTMLVTRAMALAAVGAAVGLVSGIAVVEALASWGSTTVREAAQWAVFSPVFLGELTAAVVGLAALASLAAVRAVGRIDLLEALR